MKHLIFSKEDTRLKWLFVYNVRIIEMAVMKTFLKVSHSTFSYIYKFEIVNSDTKMLECSNVLILMKATQTWPKP